MSNLVIATGVTENYLLRARAYLDSLKLHEPTRATLFAINFKMPSEPGLRVIPIDYSKCLKQPKWMLQSGGFVAVAPPDWTDDTVVSFTDADAIQQRPFTDAEVALMVDGTKNGGVMIAINKPDPTQTLEDESAALFPKCDNDEVERRFPGHRTMLAKNTGVVVATMATWRVLYRHYCDIWPKIEQTWGHYASVQWGICYVAQKFQDLRLVDLPQVLHSHGHLSLAPGVERGGDGLWRFNGEVIAFAHAL